MTERPERVRLRFQPVWHPEVGKGWFIVEDADGVEYVRVDVVEEQVRELEDRLEAAWERELGDDI
jgi:hypothetical protein